MTARPPRSTPSQPQPQPSPADGHDGTHVPREVLAPGLRETADIWFDTGRDPVVAWDERGRTFDLVDPGDPQLRLGLLRLPAPVDDPARVARVLAEGLAACDFPPTAERADPGHVAAALRAAGLDLDVR